MNSEIPLERYSIWLMPKDEVYDILKSIIQELSKKYKTPPFEPHITLLGNAKSKTETEAIKKTKKIAKIVKVFQIELKEIGYLDDYFKALFLKAEKNKLLILANKIAKEVFNLKDVKKKYTPHLSLLYGDFSEKKKKEVISKNKLKKTFVFKVDSIHLFFTGGDIKNWRKIAEFSLKH